ncbi:MAG TPA: Rieske 2Fe-2S domain-containing protein [Streptosporangiaceae bacterium]|nr:Rieske 2Fe-2S domain-containing protein [Streptosporangiaceae bacterium]
MSDHNAPGQPGEPDQPGRGDDLMAGLAGGESASGESGGSGEAPRPRRVIGTPPPAQARTLLPAEQEAEQPPAPELPAEPENMKRANRAEKLVAACFIIATLAGLGFIAAYVIFQVHSVTKVLHSNIALGTTMAVAFLAMGVGATIWVRHVMPKVELTEQRHPMRSSPENRAAFAKTFEEGADTSQFTKRPIIRRTLIAATVPIAVAPIVLLRDMGPLPRKSLEHTVWKRGTRLVVFGSNRPLTPAEFSTPGSSVSVIPEGYEDNDDALAKAATTLIKFRPGELQEPTRLNWTVNNIVAYSKICTHVGCPAALYEQTTHHILCPCHQSTFDAARGATVLFGPATRPLPQLPLMVNTEGFLVAASDYQEPVGPSYWERS